MCTKGFSFRKVGFPLIVYLAFLTLLLIIWSKRIYNTSKPMVCRLSIQSNVNLRRLRAILHDPEVYPDPEEFKPERFLNPDGTVRDDPALSLVFGAGKRICPGRHFVDATIFIVASSVLSVFNVTKAKDENGHEIPVKTAVILDRGFVM
jgi:Cytochrome P450